MAVRLCSVDDMKAILRIPAAETALDAELAKNIEAVSAECETFTGRTFTQTAYADEPHDGGHGSVVLRNFPVASSPAAVIEETDGEITAVVPAADYILDLNSGIVRLRGVGKFASGVGAVQATYTAGYASSGTGTAQKIAVPDDLSRSVAEYVAQAMRKQQAAITEEELSEARKAARKKWSGYSNRGW